MAARRARPILTRASFWIGVVLAALVVAAAAYELEANRQHIGLIALEHTLQSRNVDNMPFKPQVESLVFDGDPRLDLLVRYELPAIYQRAADGTLTAFTIAAHADCGTMATPAPDAPFITFDLPGSALRFCIKREPAPEPPSVLDIGTATPFTDLDGRPFFPTPTITFIRNGRRQGSFTQGSVDILPYLPQLRFGCDDTGACGLFAPERLVLDALSGPADSRTDDPLPVILGLTPRSDEELTRMSWTD